MCFCNEFNKRFSPKGLYQGRVVTTANPKYQKTASPKVLVKKRQHLIRNSKKVKKAIVYLIAFFVWMIYIIIFEHLKIC